MTAQVWLNPLASLSHGEVMIDYVINDCCPTVISLEHLTRTPRPLKGPLYHGLFLVLVLVLAEVVGGGLLDPCLVSTSIFGPLLEVENYLISCAQRVHTGADDI